MDGWMDGGVEDQVEGIQEKSGKIKDNMTGSMEASYSRSFPKYIHL